MSEKDIGITDIEVLFKDRDERYRRLEESRKRSVSSKREIVQRRGKIKLESIKPILIAILLSSMLLVGGHIIASAVSSYLNNRTNMNNLSQTIGSLVDDNDNSKRSILEQNVYRVQDGYAYNHEGIAKDLIALNDKDLFEYAFYSLCNDMGENMNNVISNSKTNMDLVIKNLKRLSYYGDSDFELYISSKFNNIDTFDEYLIVDNYINSDGNPSLEKALQAMDLKAEGVLRLIEKKCETKKRG